MAIKSYRWTILTVMLTVSGILASYAFGQTPVPEGAIGVSGVVESITGNKIVINNAEIVYKDSTKITKSDRIEITVPFSEAINQGRGLLTKPFDVPVAVGDTVDTVGSRSNEGEFIAQMVLKR